MTETTTTDIDAMDVAALAEALTRYRALRAQARWSYYGLWLRNHAIYLGVIFAFLFIVGNTMSSVASSGATVMIGMAVLVTWLLISRFKLGSYLKKWHGEEAAAKAVYTQHQETLAYIRDRTARLATQS